MISRACSVVVAGSTHTRASAGASTTGRRSWMSTIPPAESSVTMAMSCLASVSAPGRHAQIAAII